MVGSNTAMGAFHWLQRSFASAALIAGLLISATFSAPAASAPTSAAITAVASVKDPVGGASLDELQFSAAISDFQTIRDVIIGSPDLPSPAGRILIYSPSPEISIEIMIADGTRIDYRVLPGRSESGSSADAGEEGPRMELLSLSPTETTSPPLQLIITLIPVGD